MILALDLSTTATGWAVGKLGRGIKDFGTIRPAKKLKLGDRLVVIANAIERLLDTLDLDEVVCEELRSMRGAPVVRALCGIRGIVLYLCTKRGVPIRFTTQGKNYKSIGLKGNAKKSEVIEAVALFGHDVENDNEADAITVFYGARQTY